VTIAHYLRWSLPNRRSSHTAVVVLSNEAIAFQAYRLLHYHGISPEHLAIVGEGYSSPESVGLRKPMQIALTRSRSLAVNAALMGCLLSLAAGLVSRLETNLVLLVGLTGVLSGLCGAIVGAVIAFWGEGNAVSVYHHHLRQGRYLLLMEGSETLVRWGQEVLSQYSAPKPPR